MPIHKPSWFSEDKVMVSTAPTCGLGKGGRLRPLIDPASGTRKEVIDPETREMVTAIDDRLLDDMMALRDGRETDTLHFVDRAAVSMRGAVPVYYDYRFDDAFNRVMSTAQFSEFSSSTLAALAKERIVTIEGGHGSPSQEQRVGDVPYIKVSDLRAGLVNINPTNRVPLQVARKHWRGEQSGLQAFDLLSPERTSKNIGDFCILMPGQEQVLLTKEIIVMRPGPGANFDSFYLLWAMTLEIVRDQWRRVVFMQTNREDVGKRYLEISIPVPNTREVADRVSEPFRRYFTTIAEARSGFSEYLSTSRAHHFFVSGGEPPADEEDVPLGDIQEEGEGAESG